MSDRLIGVSILPCLCLLCLWDLAGDTSEMCKVWGCGSVGVGGCGCVCYTQVVFQTLGFISFFQVPPRTYSLGTISPYSLPGSESPVHLALSSPLP